MAPTRPVSGSARNCQKLVFAPIERGKLVMKIFMYDNMCVFVFGTDVKIFSIFSTQTVSEVNRAEAETCFLTMKINLLMLLLNLLIIFDLVLTKVLNLKSPNQYQIYNINEMF